MGKLGMKMGATMMKRKMMVAISTVACLLLSMGLSAPAQAKTDATNDDTASFRALYNKYGVPESTQDTLIDGLLAGNSMDAMKGVSPVSVETVEEPDADVTVSRYADGSINVLSAQKPKNAAAGGVQTFGSVTGCATNSGAGWATYSGCLVSNDNGAAYIKFKVNYEKYQGANARITNHYEAKSGAGFGGTMTAPDLTVFTPNSSAGYNAVVKYHAYYRATIWSSSEDIYLGFWLNNTGNWNLTAS